jgi:hypothetical protein
MSPAFDKAADVFGFFGKRLISDYDFVGVRNSLDKTGFKRISVREEMNQIAYGLGMWAYRYQGTRCLYDNLADLFGSIMKKLYKDYKYNDARQKISSNTLEWLKSRLGELDKDQLGKIYSGIQVSTLGALQGQKSEDDYSDFGT